MLFRVIIIGIGFTSRLGMIRAISRIGAEIDVIVVGHGRFKPVDCYSKYIHRYYYCQGNDQDRILQLLYGKCIVPGQKAVLIPLNDFPAKVIDNNIDRLKEHFLFPHIKMQQGALVEWMNKEKQKKLAKAIGLNVVNSFNIEIKDNTYTFPSDIKYPCFTKTQAYQKGYKGTLHRCDNDVELRAVMDLLSKRYRNITIMVEDYKNIQEMVKIILFNYSNVMNPLKSLIS